MTDNNPFNQGDSPGDTPLSPIEDPTEPVHHRTNTLHQSTSAEKGHDGDETYSKGMAVEKETISEPTALETNPKSESDKDVEGGETTPVRVWYKRALRHWKLAFFVAVWVLFTG